MFVFFLSLLARNLEKEESCDSCNPTPYIVGRPQPLANPTHGRTGLHLHRFCLVPVTGDHNKWDLRYTRKPIYLHFFTNNIWSYLLRFPVVITLVFVRTIYQVPGINYKNRVKYESWRDGGIPCTPIVTNLQSEQLPFLLRQCH